MRFGYVIGLLAPAIIFAGVAAQAQDMSEAQALYDEAERLDDEEDDEEGALALFEQACAQDLPLGCFRAGDVLFMLSDSDEEEERSLGLIRRSCDLDYAEGCREAGDRLTREEGGDPEALALFLRGCELEDRVSCKQAGYMYHIGRGAERDYVEARVWYDRACVMGDPAGCHAAGKTVIAEKGRSGYPEARTFFERGLEIDPEHYDSRMALETIDSF